jgi:hypothetical protein
LKSGGRRGRLPPTLSHVKLIRATTYRIFPKAKAGWLDRFSALTLTSPPARLEELDKAAQDVNVSRKAVIKTFGRQALDPENTAPK